MTHWTLGIIIGVPLILVLLFVVPIIGIIITKKKMQPEGASYRDPGWNRGECNFLFFLYGLAMLVGAGALVAYYPYKADYHQYQPVHGYVTTVSNKLVGTDSNVTVETVVDIEGTNYGCSDSRCTNVHRGDLLTLSCVRDWNYAALDGYRCNFIDVEH